MSDQQISNLIDPKLDGELKRLIERLQECQAAFQPIMEQVRETYKAMGAGSKDVKSMIQAFEKYNDVMKKGAEENAKYRSIQQEIDNVKQKLNDTSKEQLKILEDLKAKRQALVAEAKRELAQEAASELQKRKNTQEIKNATTQRIKEQEELRRTRQEIKRLIDMGTGELSTYRQKSAALARLRESYKDVADKGIKNAMLKEIRNLDKELKREDASLGVHTRNVGNYGRAITSLIPIVSRFSTGFGVFGAALTGTVLAFQQFTKAVRYGVQVNREFEQSTANLASILGVSRKETEALQEQALLLGRLTEFTSTQIVNAQTELAKLGFSQNTILNMTKPLLGFATALDTTIPAAAEVAGQALRAFNLTSLDTEKVLSLMTLAANRSAMDFGFLERSIAIVGASASVAGVSLKDTLSLLGVLSNAGLDASRAATALRNIFLYLVDDSKKLGKQLKGTEMTAEDIAKAFGELRKQGVNLADMFQLTDKRAVNALAVLIQNSDQVITLKNNLNDLTGTLDTLRQTRLDTLTGDLTLLQSAWDGFLLSFRENTPIIRDTIQWITEKLNEIVEKREKGKTLDESSTSYGTKDVNQYYIDESIDRYNKELQKRALAYKNSLDDQDEALKKHSEFTSFAYEKEVEQAEKVKKALDEVRENYKKLDGIIGSKQRYNYGADPAARQSLKNVQGYYAQQDVLLSGLERDKALLTEKRGVLDAGTVTLSDGTKRDMTFEEGVELRKTISTLEARINDYQSKIAFLNTQIESVFDTFEFGSADTNQSSDIADEVRKFREQQRKLYGAYITESRLLDAMQGASAEQERTLGVVSGEGLNLQSDKEKQQFSQLQERQRKYGDKNADAEYRTLIEKLKEEAALAKQLAESETASYEIRTTAADIYIAKLQKINELETERKDKGVRADVINSKIGVTAKNADEVPNSSVLDPVTGKPQTNVESKSVGQRLEIQQEALRKETELIIEHNNLINSIDKSYYKQQLSAFKNYMDERVASLQEERNKELKELDDLYAKGGIGRETYDEEAAKIELKYDQQIVEQMKASYLDWLKNLNLPTALRNQLESVFIDYMDKAKKGLTDSQTDLAVIQGRNVQGDFNPNPTNNPERENSPVVKFFRNFKDSYQGIKRKDDGSIDTKATEESGALAKHANNVAAVLGSKETSLILDAINTTMDAVNQFYDNNIERIEQEMQAVEERYEREEELMDRRLQHLQANYDAGLLSEENYEAQRRQIELQKEKQEDEKQKKLDALEKEKIKTQQRQMKFEKSQAIFNASINAANAIVSAFATQPVWLGIALAGVVAAATAAQISAISNQPIPTYALGTDDHKGGLMIVGDGGRNEYGITPDNRLFKTPNTDTLMSAPKHTKIFPDEASLLSYLFNDDRLSPLHSDERDINVNFDDAEQRSLLRGINKKLSRLNANESYRIRLERHNKTFSKW